jgi:hypothetical protein
MTTPGCGCSFMCKCDRLHVVQTGLRASLQFVRSQIMEGNRAIGVLPFLNQINGDGKSPDIHESSSTNLPFFV